MLYFDKLCLRRGKRLLFDHVSFTIHQGDKVGITGANGSGKSSLFALIRGQLEEDRGSLRIAARTSIAHVAQETPTEQIAAIEYVMRGDMELHSIQQQLIAAEQQENGTEIAHLHHRMEEIDGYAARARAARLMHGLGFAVDENNKSVESFSGGWRMRLNLAQALMCRSDLLLLDEPTNHLDLDAVIWLEEWLRRYQGALLLISHDRDFLDRCVDTIAHIEQESITLYSGNYTAFEKIRAEKLAQQQAAHDKQQREIAHMTRFVDRFRAKASKARQAQSRIRALERMQLIAAAHVDSPFHFSFEHPGHIPNPLLRLHKADAGYRDRSGDHVILQQLNLGLLPGDRIGLLGANGAGKSTLIKLLAGEIAPLKGACDCAKELRIGYFAQHQLEQLHDELSPLQHLQMLNATLSGNSLSVQPAGDRELRNYLGGFAFRDDMAINPVAPLSGGEKARLVLALLIYRKPNLLLLDEPTNHLDLDMRHALTMALQAFEGAMVLVSHDRHLLRTACDSLLLVAGGTVEPFGGDLDDYSRWLAGQRKERVGAAENDRPEKRDHKELRRLEAARSRQQQPLRNRVKKLEAELEKLLSRKDELTIALADPVIYDDSNRERLQVLGLEHAELEKALGDTEEAWMLASEELEEATRQPLQQ
ncbi:MAG: ATP-binding cassette domain-containing protein [Mariprofundaceae bacterium]|nr:ATP-binding cassette domain-containing protein [Mariprofundaceae bacterium]